MKSVSAVPDQHKAFATAFLIRAFEERLLRLFSEGKLFGTVHTCIGQEFSGIAVASQLHDGDLIVSNHRCHGHYIARTGDVDGLMAEVMGRKAGICGGRGGSQHICSKGVFSNGVQGGMTPVATGMALAHKLNGRENIAVAFIGDGTLGEGVVYETMNIASRWELPMLIVLESNMYAQSTPQIQTLAGDICRRAEAFGISCFQGDTWNPQELAGTIAKAVTHVRQKCRPVFVRVDTYRLMAHSKGDDDRPATELDEFRARDPLNVYERDHPEEARSLRASAEKAVTRAVALAEQSPFTEIEPEKPMDSIAPAWTRTRIDGRERVVSRIHEGLRVQMGVDQRIFLMGEDIQGPYGGAFKVTRNLSELFPGRVRNTPISEASIVGLANGLALSGIPTVCEIMFGDFLTLAADQIINHAAKFRWMYNDQVSTPLVIRTPMGGRRAYGATHSQSLEKHFLGIPGTRILALHHRFDPAVVYGALLKDVEMPTIVVENKTLYGEYVSDQTIAGFWCEQTDETFPTTRICSAILPDITIVVYGAELGDAEKAIGRLFDEFEVVAEVICPLQIYPLNIGPILQSVRGTGRLLVVEEGQSFCGFGSEVLAAVAEAIEDAPLKMGRLAAAPHPLPSSKSAEQASLPGVDSIVSKCMEMMKNG